MGQWQHADPPGRLELIADWHISPAMLEQIEDDLHLHCLKPAGNRTMMEILRQGQSPLIVTRIFYEIQAIPLDAAIVDEHKLVYDMLLKGSWPPWGCGSILNVPRSGRCKNLECCQCCRCRVCRRGWCA
ncbi:hypothetical protein [Pantoea sp. BAV 3049]|uniref:hypothetical protein n=1 Tax=Pantoea sp. BAV 3049 TaxID=2654188 RepID=UPI0018EEE422|nr:hypothetical protein [Pantoea sp. BAV 3049]